MRFRISYFYQRSIFYEYLAVTCYLEIDDLGSQVCVERSVLLHDIQVCICVTNPTGCWIAVCVWFCLGPIVFFLFFIEIPIL